MNLIYFDPYPNKKLEDYIRQYGELLRHNGEPPVYCKRVETVEEVLKEADVSEAGDREDGCSCHSHIHVPNRSSHREETIRLFIWRRSLACTATWTRTPST